MTVRVQRDNTIVVVRFIAIVGDIPCVVQVAVQHIIAAGNVEYTAIGQHHIVRINLTQTQRQLCTVVHGNGVGIQLSCLFSQCRTAVAIQIQAIGCYRAVVADVQARRIGQGDGIRQQAGVFNIDLRLVVHRQRVDVGDLTGIPLGTVIQRHVEQAALINLFTCNVTVAIKGRIRPDAVWRKCMPVYIAVAFTIHLRRADGLNAGLRGTHPFTAVGQRDIQLVGIIPAVGSWVIDAVIGGIRCRIAILVEVVIKGAGEKDVAGNGRVIEGSGGLHSVIRRASHNDQRRIIRSRGVGFTVVARLRRLTVEAAGTQIAVRTGGQHRVFHHQRIGKDIAAVSNAFNTVVWRVIQILVTLRQRDTRNVGIVLNNDIRFNVQRDGVTQIIGVQIMRFSGFAIDDIIRVMLVGIVDGGVINGQAKTIILGMSGAVSIYAICTRRGHTL